MDLLYILLAFLLGSFVKHCMALLSVNICQARPVLLVAQGLEYMSSSSTLEIHLAESI